MDDSGIKLLNLMFREGETVCVSHNKYGYHSIPFSEAIADKVVTLVPTEDSCEKRNIAWSEENFDKVHTNSLILAALNPMQGYRVDANCYKFRNFLIEIDVGPLNQQFDYIHKFEMPYSAAIFSGNKSIHFLISLDQEIPSEKDYRTLGEWMLNIITLADKNCKNPSRSIRIPGAIRDNGNKQRLLYFNGPVKLTDLAAWLAKYPSAKPKEYKRKAISEAPDLTRIPVWVSEALLAGVDRKRGRNKQWFTIACQFAIAGFDLDGTIDKLLPYFHEERDFKEREWKSCIKSGFKHIHENGKH